MLYPECYLSTNGKLFIKFNIHIIIFLIISNVFLIHCGDDGVIEDTIPKEEDNIIIFNHTKLNAGSTNKNGDLIIEYYSEENYYDIPNSILFYCFSKNGRQCFSNETSYTQEKNIEIDEIVDIAGFYNIYSIYDSKNLFVSIKNDSNRGDQYLFSINSYNSIVELHNFNNNIDKERYFWDYHDFFDLDEDSYNFQYERELYELRGESQYIIAFIPKYNVDESLKDLTFLKKFSLKSLDYDAYEELKSINFNNYVKKQYSALFLWTIVAFLLLLVIKFQLIPIQILILIHMEGMDLDIMGMGMDMDMDMGV